MGLGQSKQYQWNRDPRYPNFQPYQPRPQPFIPGYMPVNYPQPMFPQPGFIPPTYGQGAVLPPQQLHYFADERQPKRRTRRSTRAGTFVGGFIPPDQRSPPEVAHRRARSEARRPRETVVAPVHSPAERNQTHRAPTPFIPRMAEADEEDEEEEEEEADRRRGVPAARGRPAPRQFRQSPIHYEQPPDTSRGDISVLQPMPPANRSAYGPSGPKPLAPLQNPLPPPPKDLYEMSPYKSLLTLPQTTALLTATYGPQQGTVTVAPLNSNGNMTRKKSIFRAFSRKDKKPQPEQKNPVFIPVFVPDSSQPQPPFNQPLQSSIRRSSTQVQQSHSQDRPRFQSQRRPFAGAGPRDIPTPTTAEPTTGGTYQTQDDSDSVSGSVLSDPIPPHPSNPPTIKFDQTQSYTQFMNHSPHRVMWDNLTYPTALHLHEALKFLDHRPDIAEQIRKCGSVHEVYPLTARYLEFQRPDWGEQFLPLMEEVLYNKFRQHPDLRIMLLGTGHANLEYADAVDDYWGSGADGLGANQLGKVLTRVRERLREDTP